MTSCCQKKSCDLEKMSKSQSRVLWIVLSINLVMFFIEMVSGYISHSLSLLGDSLDMLGDSIAYGSSLYVINRGVSWKAKSAILKGSIMMVTAAVVFMRAIYQIIDFQTPNIEIMTTVGFIALAANLVCLSLLTKHKSDDINMSSVWTCSRNDIIANVSVLGAAGLVVLTKSPLPDILVGLGLAVLFARSSLSVISEAKQTLIVTRSV